MNAADFGALFDSFTHSVFRLELRPFYSVGGAEAERLKAFKHGTPRPERSVRTSEWMARIATSTVQLHKHWARVRVVDDPLTEYQRAQLESYKESQAVGEQIYLTRRTDRIGSVPDFWLFDVGTKEPFAVLMRYADDGSLISRDLVEDRSEIDRLAELAGLLQDEAVPLNEFLAEASAELARG